MSILILLLQMIYAALRSFNPRTQGSILFFFWKPLILILQSNFFLKLNDIFLDASSVTLRY